MGRRQPTKEMATAAVVPPESSQRHNLAVGLLPFFELSSYFLLLFYLHDTERRVHLICRGTKRFDSVGRKVNWSADVVE